MSHNEDNRSSPWWIVNNDNDDNDAISGRFWLSAPPLKKSIRNRIRRKGRKGKSGLTFAHTLLKLTNLWRNLHYLCSHCCSRVIGSQCCLDRLVWPYLQLSFGGVLFSQRPASAGLNGGQSGLDLRRHSSIIRRQQAYILHRYQVPSAVRSTCFNLVTFSDSLLWSRRSERRSWTLGPAVFLLIHLQVCSLKDPIVVGRLKRQA